MIFVMPVESIVQNKGGVLMYDPISNKIIKQYIHNKEWKRVGWRGGKIYNDILIATDWNDIHYFDIENWKYIRTYVKKSFNDLHYIEINNGKLYVVNTGLDAIEVFKDPMKPKFERIEFMFEKNSKLFKKRDIDLNVKYNKMMKFKPHSAHPNSIAFDEERSIVTCFGKNQKINSGELIDFNTGKRFSKKCLDCHDGIFYKDNFYTTHTRHAKIIVFKKDIEELANPIKRIPIGAGNGWWRGMVIHDDIAYVFASDGYKKKKATLRLAKVNLNTGKSSCVRLPVLDGVHWDTVYQPNIWRI